MNEPTLICTDEERRHNVRKDPRFNGLDYVEIYIDEATGTVELVVYFLDKAPEKNEETGDEPIKIANVRIEGGRRVRDIRVTGVRLCRRDEPDRDDCMVVTLDKPGDFSTYRLCLVELDENDRPTDQPLAGFDPRYACVEFSFQENCPSDLDCAEADLCPPERLDEPEINYLAKDYASFRQLILDRLSLVMPDWQERHVPDLGIALVEVLAYAGDHLSYYQDAAATEGYLGTARQRISVRRHARLVDYAMHEGNNARTWLFVEVDSNLELDPDDTGFVTSLSKALPLAGTVLAEHELQGVASDQFEWFEPLVKRPDGAERGYEAAMRHQRWVVEVVQGRPEPIKLHPAHNRIRLYTWGDAECCLPKGATTATLYDGRAVQIPIETPKAPEPEYQQEPAKGSAPEETADESVRVEYERELQLESGDYVLFEEIRGPKTGNPADADPKHRHVVRIVDCQCIVDELCQQPVLEITWAEEDALPFPVCISAISDPPDCEPLEDISIARGNIILVDHGRRVHDEDLGCVPVDQTRAECECGRLSEISYLPGRFRPRLERGPLTFSQPLPEQITSASQLIHQDPRQAVPWIQLASFADPDCPPQGLPVMEPDPEDEESDDDAPNSEPDPQNETEAIRVPAGGWDVRFDLLGSGPADAHFVAEMDNDRRSYLRFGDGEMGDQPDAGDRFVTTYRVGGGPAGNIGAETISHLVYRRVKQDGIRSVRNPLPASGGRAPEPLEDVKLYAPHAFRRQLERAITADDYAQIVMCKFAAQVQRAAATLRWTGSWYEVLVAIDARGGAEPDQELLDEIAGYLYPYRRVGHDLAVRPARQVPLDIELEVCVLPDYLAGHVKAALLAIFSNRMLPDGRLGFFHPDNLTFGQGIYLSRLVAEAQAVPGVENVQVNKLERFYEGPNDEIEAGVLSLGPLEVGRLDNDPSFPENGQLTLIMRGGR